MTDPLAARALRFLDIVTETARAAKEPGFTVDAWNALVPLVATDAFLLVGRAKQQLDWPNAVAHMDRWARETMFGSRIRRLEQVDSVVYMELDEESSANGETRQLNTMTVFEFDTAGRLCRMDCFQ